MLLFPKVADAVAVARYVADRVVEAHAAGEDPAAPVFRLLDVIDRIFVEALRGALIEGQEKLEAEFGENFLAGPYKPTDEVLRESS